VVAVPVVVPEPLLDELPVELLPVPVDAVFAPVLVVPPLLPVPVPLLPPPSEVSPVPVVSVVAPPHAPTGAAASARHMA
jgi:hypothetical protein